MTYLQPGSVPADLPPDPEWKSGPVHVLGAHPLSGAEIEMLAGFVPEDIYNILGDSLTPHERIAIARDIQAVQAVGAAQEKFERDVTDRRHKLAVDREARQRDQAERDEYLSSDHGRTEAAQAFEAEIIDLDDLEDPEPLIDGYLHRDTLVRTFGPPKSLKSFATLDMAACVSLGIPWQGRPTKRATVLYVVAEGARGVKKRRAAWNEHHGREMEVIFFPKPVQIANQEEMYRLISFCLTKGVGYVIFDTQARCTVGVEENDNTEMGAIVAALDILKQQTKACVHMVHHSVGSDPKKARGATAWDGAVDAEFYTKRDGARVTLVTKFQKDISEADDLNLMTVEVGHSLVLERTETTSNGEHGGDVAPALVTDANAFYLAALQPFGARGATQTDMVNDLKDRGTPRSRTAVKKAFAALEAGGAIESAGVGTAMVITQSGLVFLDQWRLRSDPRLDET